MRFSQLLLITPAVAALAATASAQGSVVIPSAAATARPSAGSPWSSTVFYSTSSATTAHDSRTQAIYDSTDVGVSFAVLTGLQVRRPQGLGNQNPAMTTNLTLSLSTIASPFASASTNFAANHGANVTQVFSGPISLPLESNPASWPAPWQLPFVFTTPFVFSQVPGESLVIDLTQTGNSATTPWYVEHSRRDIGNRLSNPSANSNCRFSNNQYNNSLSYSRPVVGGPWYVSYGSLLPNVVGIGAFGLQGVGGTWAGQPLPINLGFLGSPTCTWNIEPLVTVGIVASATGSGRWPTLTIPNNPALGGVSFFDHSLWIDPAANPGGLVTGWSSEWIIGTNTGVPGAVLTASGNSAGNATGTLSLEEVPTFQLNY